MGEVYKMLLRCKICDADESEGFCTRCDHVRDKFERLEKELFHEKQKTDKMQDAVRKLLLDYKLDIFTKDGFEVEGKLLKLLWDATENGWYDVDTADRFISTFLADNLVLCEIIDVFCTKYCCEDIETRLEKVRKALEDSRIIHKYEACMDLTTEDVIREAAIANSCRGKSKPVQALLRTPSLLRKVVTQIVSTVVGTKSSE